MSPIFTGETFSTPTRSKYGTVFTLCRYLNELVIRTVWTIILLNVERSCVTKWSLRNSEGIRFETRTCDLTYLLNSKSRRNTPCATNIRSFCSAGGIVYNRDIRRRIRRFVLGAAAAVVIRTSSSNMITGHCVQPQRTNFAVTSRPNIPTTR